MHSSWDIYASKYSSLWLPVHWHRWHLTWGFISIRFIFRHCQYFLINDLSAESILDGFRVSVCFVLMLSWWFKSSMTPILNLFHIVVLPFYKDLLSVPLGVRVCSWFCVMCLVMLLWEGNCLARPLRFLGPWSPERICYNFGCLNGMSVSSWRIPKPSMLREFLSITGVAPDSCLWRVPQNCATKTEISGGSCRIYYCIFEPFTDFCTSCGNNIH